MSRKARSAEVATAHQSAPRVSPLWLPVALAAGCGLMLALFPTSRRASPEVPSLAINRINIDGAPTRLAEAAELRDDQLQRFDIAQLNLLAAQDLPGCEGQDVEKLLTQLDDWTRRVRIETSRNEHRFREHPEQYENSEAYFRMGMLVTVLQQDFGVRYNPDLIAPAARATPETDKDFLSNCANVFLTGILRDRIGTCASMPALYVAMGRRLGYPVKLVSARDHLFVRWENERERRNIEGTSQGIVCHPDEYYVQWRKISDAEIKSGWQLKSLSPREELAVFLLTRAGALRFHQRDNDAVVTYAQAHRLWPGHPDFQARLVDAIAKAFPNYFRAPPDPVRQTLRPRDPLDTLREVETLTAC